MNSKTLVVPLRILGFVVLAAMAGALIYAFSIALANWASIAV